MTPDDVRSVLKLIAAAYPTQRQRMSNDDVRAMAAIYTAGLIDLDLERVSTAVNRIVKSSHYMPTIAEIRAAAVDTAHGSRSPGGEAWGRCLQLIRRYGLPRWPGIDFEVSDPILLVTIRAFGWAELCNSENQHADRARFIELYDQLAAGERKEAAIAPGATSKALPQRTQEPRSMRELVTGLLPEGESR